MTAKQSDSNTVTELFPEKKQLPLQGLYLGQGLAKMSAEMEKALVITTFLTDKNGVIAKADGHGQFQVPPETRNASDWRLSQELMAQADVLIVGGSYLRRLSASIGSPQDILFQFEQGGGFEELGEWRLRMGYRTRSPNLAVVTRHLDFQIPQQTLSSGRRIVAFTADEMAKSREAKAFTRAGTTVMGRGKLGVDANRMIDYLRDEMRARVIVMMSGPRVFELLLQAGRLDLVYITQVEREIEIDDPSTVLTLLPNGKSVQDLPGFSLARQYVQEYAIAGDGKPISQIFLRCDRL